MNRRGAVRFCPGARAAEAGLLEDLDRLCAGDPWQRRVQLIVASADLREHWLARLAARHGALLGVRVVTLWAFARELLERDDPAGPVVAEPLFDLLAARCASQQPVLREQLGRLDGGDALAVASIRALIDAGFDPAARDALDEAVATIAAPSLRARAAAIVDAAAATLRAAARQRVGTSEQMLRRAAAAVDAAQPERLGALLVHGFADATGLGGELLAALRRAGATLYVDAPPDPHDPARRFDRLARDLAQQTGGVPEMDQTEAPGPAQLEACDACGQDGEARELAHRVGAAIDRGVAPERILVVARQLGPYATALRRRFAELGIPFSGPAAPAGFAPAARRWHAALALLARAETGPIERWLTARGDRDAAALRLGLRVLGIRDLHELAGLRDADLRDVPLPVRSFDDDGRAAHARLPAAALTAARAEARALAGALDAWPRSAPLELHAARLSDLLGGALGWPAAARAPVAAALAALPPLEVSRDEFGRLLAPLVEAALAPPLGGAGAGVRVTDALHARGIVADELFVLGLHRGSFPRAAAEDPLLPDPVRHLLGAVLPALRPAARAADEERQIFAGLLSSAPRVTLCWQRADDEGRERSRSPFLDLLAIAGRLPPVASAPKRLDEQLAADARGGRALPPTELLVHAGLAGGAAGHAAALARHRPREAAWQRARIETLAHWDREQDVPRLRAWFGWIGAGATAALPGLALPSVTFLESYARCGWRALLERVLGIERLPDPSAALPEITTLLLGDTVHLALARLLDPEPGGDLAGVTARARAAIAPADPATITTTVACAADELADAHGLRLPGLREVLVERARALVAAALAYDFGGDAPPVVLGTEVAGRAEVALDGAPRAIRFRADRVDRRDGRIVVTDYKTGKPPQRFAEERARGLKLQAAAYACADLPGQDVLGRYLHLRPDGVVAIECTRDEAAASLPAVGAILFAGLAHGWFPPRVEGTDGREPRTCLYCELKEACVRGDSGMRRRLVALAADEGPELGPLRELWRLAGRREP